MACLPQLGSVPAAYAVVAGDCDWLLLPVVGLSNNDDIALRALGQFRYVPSVACVALDGGSFNTLNFRPIFDCLLLKNVGGPVPDGVLILTTYLTPLLAGTKPGLGSFLCRPTRKRIGLFYNSRDRHGTRIGRNHVSSRCSLRS